MNVGAKPKRKPKPILILVLVLVSVLVIAHFGFGFGFGYLNILVVFTGFGFGFVLPSLIICNRIMYQMKQLIWSFQMKQNPLMQKNKYLQFLKFLNLENL